MNPNIRSLSIAGRVVLAGAALLVVAACAKKEGSTTDTSASSGAIAATEPAGLQVAHVALGKRIGPDKRISDETDKFGVRDTIYASVHTTGTAQGANVVARWTFQDGQVVDERTETISQTGGDTYTEFHVAKPSGWPEGKYTLQILVNGQEVQKKDFTIEK